MTTDMHFRATGPGVGFDARADSNDGMVIGVRGIGSSGNTADIAATTGVTGYTATRDGLAIADGTGVRGLTRGGTGVHGSSLGADGIGVTGTAIGQGTGVKGSAESGIAVQGESAAGIGVFGVGSAIGVQGTGDHIGVLGGPPLGRAFSTDDGVLGIGIVGTGVGDVRVGDVTYAYGAWFDALNGTAPLHLEPSPQQTPPQAALRGDFFVDDSGRLWFCTDAGQDTTHPATWRQVQLT